MSGVEGFEDWEVEGRHFSASPSVTELATSEHDPTYGVSEGSPVSVAQCLTCGVLVPLEYKGIHARWHDSGMQIHIDPPVEPPVKFDPMLTAWMR